MHARILLLACAAFTSVPGWAVYKCKAPDGQVVFQDTACVGQGASVKVWSSGASGASGPQTESAARVRADVEAVHLRARVREAIQMHEPLVGMTRAELEQAMGAPTQVNASTLGGISREKIFFDQPGQSWYVYTENGTVTSIQNRANATVARSTDNTAGCPSSLDIRNMETSASSITLSERERRERREQIAEARRCGR